MDVLASQTTGLAAQVPDPSSVSAAVSLKVRRLRLTKCGDTLGLFDHCGDIHFIPGSTDGIYHRDTRHLSRLDLTLGGTRPLLLSSTLGTDNLMLTSDLCNVPTSDPGAAALDQGAIHLQRSLIIGEGTCHVRLAIRNFASTSQRTRLELRFEADFADLFEVRGMHRERRGEQLSALLTGNSVTLSYSGLDQAVRATNLAFEPAPQALTAGCATFDLDLEPHGRGTIFFTLACLYAGCSPETAARLPRAAFLAAYVHAKRRLRASVVRMCNISSDQKAFEQTMRRSANDLRMLITEKPTGPHPYAGIPWFSTAFGRDALITALLMLAFDPALALGVLRYLAQEQATEFDPASEAEPGKILHKVRSGEMAALGEVPFRRYYGSVDSTPLFVVLSGAYLDRTGDLKALQALWPNIDLALGWMDRRADVDGFVRYERSTQQGLASQGWKDSSDSNFHADGRLAQGAIALCEVQAYVYAARKAGAAIARRLGFGKRAAALEAKAQRLRQAFESRFWCERLGTYALSLDGEGRPCEVRSSNAGHVLLSGIATPERARQVAKGLMGPSMFTGWGIRTLAADEVRYNPMSYHNGSVWPHDNAMIALGMARVGLRLEAARLFDGIYAASGTMDLRRLPELFCGFHRRPGQGPTSYPVACAPQARAAAAIPAFVQASLGLIFDPADRAVRFNRPGLPAFIDNLILHNLSLNDAKVSVRIRRVRDEVSVSVIKREGNIQVVTMT